ncbi:MAG: hypothetical protein HRT67_02885 [Flavobacteriaceae bacterium]|nr:hypothetical protein [Flavobacteriaceae bacterium]
MSLSKIYQLSSPNLWNLIDDDFGNSGGVYKLFSKKNEQRKPINRLLKTDINGILYIGKADSFVNRIITLQKVIHPTKYKSTNHSGGRRYNRNSRISDNYPYHSLYIELSQHNNPKERESEILNSYFQEFGEVPPLNANDQ